MMFIFLNNVTVSYSFTQFSTLAKIHTTTTREPSIYLEFRLVLKCLVFYYVQNMSKYVIDKKIHTLEEFQNCFQI